MSKQENLYCQDHQVVKDSYREGWDRIYGRKGKKESNMGNRINIGPNCLMEDYYGKEEID